ncbi:VOC family protein [Gilvimarinus chinensis]|uniref:VOC family protein n=1 Tax=Gilvimarinus chinensis TaxID=396005 RepID=UPI0003629519|nr:VOC family protein [Gilvimarinus chinensis]
MINSQHAPYLEIPSRSLSASKEFFTRVFHWSFTDYGAEYCAFDSGFNLGGFYLSETVASGAQSSCLIVFYSQNLAQTEKAVIAAGGTICAATFAFPGGRRFHFTEPGGSEFAVWSDR